jgi:hypothetical protein
MPFLSMAGSALDVQRKTSNRSALRSTIVAEVIDAKCCYSLKAFFQAARDVPPGTNDFNFFYNVSVLNCGFGWHDYYTEEEDRALTLYTVSEGLYGDPDGLV